MEADDVMELALDTFEILMPEKLEKIHKLFALVIKTYGKYQEQKADDAFTDTVAGVEVEALARDMARFCQRFQADTGLFPLDYRKRFLDVFITENPDVRLTPKLYNTITATINACFDKLEAAVREKYSDGERVVLRQELLTQSMVDETYRAVLDVRDTARDTNDMVRDIQDTVRQIANRPATIQTLHTSNGDYKIWFQRPLFLHVEKNDKVNLSNLFVKHKFEVKRGNPGWPTVDECLAGFLRGISNYGLFLFIEGDAGCGKTSLTEYMAYHYEQRDDTMRQIFGDKRLITVRLREIERIPTDCRPEQCLTRAILRFLYDNDHDNDNLKRFQKSGARLLWLDGYDELCTMDGIDPQAALWSLESLGCKIVITSRPNYIRFDHSKRYCHIALKHFDKEQRQEWRENYQSKCGETLGDVNREYLERDAVGICDTPMGLYMVAAGHFTEAMLDNEWALYYQIFHEEIKNTRYNKPFGGFDWQHPSASDWESLYRVSEEIAWYLYQHKNADLLVSYETVDAIIDGLGLQGDKGEIVKRCFALCGYWNTRTKQGYVEFYHNNIRDFFLCEKLVRELNQTYQKYQDILRDDKKDILPVLECLCELFQYDNLEKQVLEFLGQRASYAPGICVETEKAHHNTVSIFETLLINGEPYSVCKKRENPVEIVARVLRNTVGVYRYLYEAFLPNGTFTPWYRDVDMVKQNITFQHLRGEIFHFAGSSYLRGADLTGADLKGADLHSADLNNADLSRACLQGACLQGADLRDADLTCADLIGADLYCADLTRAVLHNASLHDADLTGADLIDAHLTDAHLIDTDLTGADLKGANLTGAVLNNATLTAASLHSADLTRAVLRDAYLYGADLTRAVLKSADLYNADLSYADLRNTDLRGAKIEECNMENIFGEPIMY